MMAVLNSAGLNITKSPQDERVSLATEGPLFLSFVVCGSRQNFSELRFAIDISRGGVGANVRPMPNSSPVRDSDAETYGISTSLSNVTSSYFEICNEILVRVWTDHPNVLGSTVELLLRVRIMSRIRTSRGGKYFLYLPDEVPTTTTAVITTAAMAASTASTSEISTTYTQLPMGGEGAVDQSAPAPTEDTPTTIIVMVSAILGSLLFVSISINIIVVVAALKHKRRGNRKYVGGVESAGTANNDQETSTAVVLDQE